MDVPRKETRMSLKKNEEVIAEPVGGLTSYLHTGSATGPRHIYIVKTANQHVLEEVKDKLGSGSEAKRFNPPELKGAITGVKITATALTAADVEKILSHYADVFSVCAGDLYGISVSSVVNDTVIERNLTGTSKEGNLWKGRASISFEKVD